MDSSVHGTKTTETILEKTLLDSIDKNIHECKRIVYVSVWKKCTHIKVASQLKVSYTTSRVLWLMHFLNTDIRFGGHIFADCLCLAFGITVSRRIFIFISFL